MFGPMKQVGWRLIIKRAFDVSVATAALVATAPILAVAGLAVRVTMGSPILFRQTRPGLNARPIRIFKLRTMRETVTASGPLPDAERLTPLGQLLRSTSIDELPQLINVLWGQMSIVGPRPLLMKYLDLYTDEQARRHDVLPGMTGWSQVNGRNSLSWPEKLALDVWYVENWGLFLDAKILARTALGVFRREGISNGDHVTMPELTNQRLTS